MAELTNAEEEELLQQLTEINRQIASAYRSVSHGDRSVNFRPLEELKSSQKYIEHRLGIARKPRMFAPFKMGS